MKKFFSVLLALVMVLGMSTAVWAASETVVENKTASEFSEAVTSTKPVNVTYTAGAKGADSIVNRYYVTVEWTISDAAYTKAGATGTKYTWNGETQKYETTTVEGATEVKTAGSAKVVVTNKSDQDIKVSSSYTATLADTSWAGADDTQTTVPAVDGTGTLEVAQAKQDYSDKTPSAETYEGAVNFGATMPTAAGEMGKVTVTISK